MLEHSVTGNKPWCQDAKCREWNSNIGKCVKKNRGKTNRSMSRDQTSENRHTQGFRQETQHSCTKKLPDNPVNGIIEGKARSQSKPAKISFLPLFLQLPGFRWNKRGNMRDLVSDFYLCGTSHFQVPVKYTRTHTSTPRLECWWVNACTHTAIINSSYTEGSVF